MNNVATTTRQTLSAVISDVLMIERTNDCTNTAHEIVNKIIKVITDALLRGERVSIQGFGILYIRTKKKTRSACGEFYEGKRKLYGTYITEIPEKKYVFFKPSKVLLRMINGRNES